MCTVFPLFHAVFGMQPKSPKIRVIRGNRVKSGIPKYATTGLKSTKSSLN